MIILETRIGRHGQTVALKRRDDGRLFVRESAHVWSDARVCGGQTFRESARNIYSAFDEAAAREIYAGA